MIGGFMLWLALAFVFVLGAVVGSGINVCVVRLPYEKSVIWPGSHCGRCFQPVRWFDNVPLLGYSLLRGRCRTCGTTFSARYFFVELFTGCAFAALFCLEVVANVLDLKVGHRWGFGIGGLEPGLWLTFAYHAVLLSLLLTASLCDLEHMEIPLAITVTGTLVGLVGSTLFPWPWPSAGPAAPTPSDPFPLLPAGTYPWPVWHPLPAWLPPGSWRLGLATGLAGALAGTFLLRAIRFLFGLGRGMEGLGLGDADLMMMAGAFVGWQAVVVAMFVGVVPALLFGIAQALRRGEEAMPFGPSLALGVLITLLCWRWIGPQIQLLFFDSVAMGAVVVLGGVFLLAVSFALRLVRGTPPPDSDKMAGP